MGKSRENNLLRSCLLRDTLSVKVADVDIRRSGDSESFLGLGISPIETDYILEVRSSQDSENSEQLKRFFCSKRYVDIRNLAYALHSYAEGVVEYYAEKNKPTKKNPLGDGGKRIILGLEKILEKPIEAAQYITNTESNFSDLAGELESLLGNSSTSHSSEDHAKRRTSKFLNKKAPVNVHAALDAVDEFYESILAEKRQFGKKSSFDRVRRVAERRKGIIDDAFSNFMYSLAKAGSLSEDHDSPPVLNVLANGLEYFLSTDVVIDPNLKMSSRSSSKAQDSLDIASIQPRSMRHRASQVERAKQRNFCAGDHELVMNEDIELHHNSSESTKSHRRRLVSSVFESKRILPNDPVNISIALVAGAVFFKCLEGHVIVIQLDVLAMLLLSSALIGYHIASGVSSNEPKFDNDFIIRKDVSFENQKLQPNSSNSFEQVQSEAQSTASHTFIRTSFYKMGAIFPDSKKTKEVAAKTFRKFPDGAAIGSHHNCWSSPPASTFHIRGDNYFNDKKKIPSDEFIFPCRGCDLFLTDNAPSNIGRNSHILGGKVRDLPTFIINYRLPWGIFVSYHEIPEKFTPFLRRKHGCDESSAPLPLLSGMSPGERAVCNFFLSDPSEKNAAWKIVPVVVEGPWVVKRVVGGKPAIVGTKLPITYSYQPPEPEFGFAEYFEADLDIVSSPAARNILALVRSYTQSLTIDLGFVVQGNSTDELPEQMMMGLRLHGLDPLTADILPRLGDYDFEALAEEDDLKSCDTD